MVKNQWKYAGLSLEKICIIFRILGRDFGPNFGFPYMFYISIYVDNHIPQGHISVYHPLMHVLFI